MTTSAPQASRSAALETVSILMVAYRATDELLACVRSIRELPDRSPREIIVMNNDPGDGLVELMAEREPTVRVVESPGNVGFARAVNAAAHEATGHHLLLLNPDMVIRPGAVDALVDHSSAHPGAGLVGGRTLNPDGSVEPRSCWDAPSLWSVFCFATGLSTAFSSHPVLDPEAIGGWDRDTVRDVGVVTGCMLMATRDVWDRLGGFDERFWMYGEDLDLSLRARDLGFRPQITPDAEAVHYVGVSSSSDDRRVMVLKGRMTVYLTHFGRVRGRVAQSLTLGGVAARAGASRLRRATERGDAGSGRRSDWEAAWVRRREWRSGYGPGDDS
ncbi:glycosyltransferase family 2 protein [Ilumatobacter sp.]|uniref:glycosyltransferase family 2 protein n=1 Tax=Ilumatobacter sp. TaxID=1967498 RepID=UPI003B52F6C6